MKGEAHLDLGARLGRASRDRAAVRRGNRLDDREPETGALARARRAGAAEALERAIAEVGSESGAVVADGDAHLPALLAGPQLDVARAVAQRVVHEVRERLLEPQRVGHRSQPGGG